MRPGQNVLAVRAGCVYAAHPKHGLQLLLMQAAGPVQETLQVFPRNKGRNEDMIDSLKPTVYFDNNRARLRQLLDGRFIAEVKVLGLFGFVWKGVFHPSPCILLTPDNYGYESCLGTSDACERALANRGISS